MSCWGSGEGSGHDLGGLVAIQLLDGMKDEEEETLRRWRVCRCSLFFNDKRRRRRGVVGSMDGVVDEAAAELGVGQRRG